MEFGFGLKSKLKIGNDGVIFVFLWRQMKLFNV